MSLTSLNHYTKTSFGALYIFGGKVGTFITRLKSQSNSFHHKNQKTYNFIHDSLILLVIAIMNA